MIFRFRTIVKATLILGVLLLYIPLYLLHLEEHIDGALTPLLPYGGILLFVMGTALSFLGVYYLIRRGDSTPLCGAPPQRLVVAGPYAYLQHPILLGVLTMACGEALWLRSLSVGLYAAILAIGSHVYVLYVEEPVLMQKFGSDYRAYQRAVPRWFPQLLLSKEDEEA